MITEIKVTYENGRKAAEEYCPPKKASITLTAQVPDDVSPEDALDQVTQLAMDKVHEMLNLSSAPRQSTTTASIKPAETADNVTPPKTTRKKTTEPAGKAAMIMDEPETPAATLQEETTSAATIVDEPEPNAKEAPAGAASMDDWASSPNEAAVTDADLNAACQTASARLGGVDGGAGLKIRGLIGTYSPDQLKPFQLREIPAAQRADFLAKLKVLT